MKKANEMIGKYVVVRGRDSGVFAGTLAEKEGQEVCLLQCRRLWYWAGGASISQIAVEGVNKPSECKFTVTKDEIIITDVIEIIPCTNEAEKIIKEVAVWSV